VIDNLLDQLKLCKFRSLEEMNHALNKLMTRLSTKLEFDTRTQEFMVEKTQYYLDDLCYESGFIDKTLRTMEKQLKELLKVKPSSPVVLALEPTFTVPKFYETQDVVYIG
jgi:hypothetical protein